MPPRRRSKRGLGSGEEQPTETTSPRRTRSLRDDINGAREDPVGVPQGKRLRRDGSSQERGGGEEQEVDDNNTRTRVSATTSNEQAERDIVKNNQDDGQQGQESVARVEDHYDRIKSLPQWKRWEVLIPKYPVHRMKEPQKSFVSFGAKYHTAESAARAADKALIAVWGRGDAEEHLNFPLSNYDPNECFQRYGVDLSHYLVSIAQKGKEMASAAAKRHSPHSAFSLLQLRRYQQARRIGAEIQKLYEENPWYKFHTKPCGVCLACRQPWLGKVCARFARARDIGYRSKEHARMAVEGVEAMAYHEARAYAKSRNEKDIALAITEELERKYPLPELEEEPRRVKKAVPVDEHIADRGEGKEESVYTRKPTDFEWVTSYGSTSQRDYAKRRADAGYRQMNLKMEYAVAKEVNAVRDAIIEDDSFVKYEHPIRERQRDDGGYYEMLRSIDVARKEGSDILFIKEDSPIWMRPRTYTSQQCPYCRKWHGPHLKLCPYMQATCSIPKSKPLCNLCEDSGCDYCTKGSLPASAWTPEFARVPWVDKVSPEMLHLMLSMQHIGNAAISELKSPLIAGKLTANALLAMAVMAEVMIDDALEEQYKKE